MQTNPIIYKKIPCQFAFYIKEFVTDGKILLLMKQLTTLPSQKEAKQFISKLKEIL